MKLTHKFAVPAPKSVPKIHLDATGLRFETMDHGGEYPDVMPQAIKLIDSEGRSCVYVPNHAGWQGGGEFRDACLLDHAREIRDVATVIS